LDSTDQLIELLYGIRNLEKQELYFHFGNIKSQLFKLLSAKMKQKVQTDLLDVTQTKKTRFDISGELKNDSSVMHTYGHDETYNKTSKVRR
jgi:hypothetical protein